MEKAKTKVVETRSNEAAAAQKPLAVPGIISEPMSRLEKVFVPILRSSAVN